jgi:hypothetical protein
MLDTVLSNPKWPKTLLIHFSVLPWVSWLSPASLVFRVQGTVYKYNRKLLERPLKRLNAGWPRAAPAVLEVI